MKYIATLLLPLLLVGCATTKTNIDRLELKDFSSLSTSAMPPPAPAPVISPMPAPPPSREKAVETNVVSSFIIAGAYLEPKQKFSALPVNIIFFPKKPITKEAEAQYVFICEMWKANFPRLTEVEIDANHPVDVGIVPMYWMVKKISTDETCETLVKTYDYTRAQVFAAQNKVTPTKIQILCKLRTGVITMDISNIVKHNELQMAMDVWRVKMLKPPKSNSTIYAYSLLHSTKEVLGALGKLLAMN